MGGINQIADGRGKQEGILSTSKNKIEIIAVDTFEQLDKYAADWNELAAKSPLRLPMLAHAWVAPYLKHRLPDHEGWTCLLALEKSSLVGVIPIIHGGASARRKR